EGGVRHLHRITKRENSSPSWRVLSSLMRRYLYSAPEKLNSRQTESRSISFQFREIGNRGLDNSLGCTPLLRQFVFCPGVRFKRRANALPRSQPRGPFDSLRPGSAHRAVVCYSTSN